MSETCAICGLPKELCVCKEISKGEERIGVHIERRHGRKFLTIISGFEQTAGLKELVKEMKRELACGGTLKDNRIELQGDHRDKIKEILVSKNYRADQIDVR